MNKTLIGILFIVAGLLYGSLAFDVVNNLTLGYLVKNGWLKPPVPGKMGPQLLGSKGTILLYSFILIIFGVFILWNRNS